MTEPETRHGKRADGKTQTSISLRKDLLEAAKEAAEKENRSFSNWLELLLSEKVGKGQDSKLGNSAKKG